MSAQLNALPIEQITPNVLQLARLAARSKDADKIKYDRALAQLKQLVENPNGQDGAYWQWSWTAFCHGFAERGILPIKEVLKQHQSSAEEPPAKQPPAEEPSIEASPTREPSVEPERAQEGAGNEPLERLTWRVNVALKKADAHQIAAGLGLLELKKRITDKTSNEGKP
jgi:hypothetical protein